MTLACRSLKHGALFSVALTFSILCSINVSLPKVMADRGGFPYISQTHVTETGQRAVIAWNGTQEVLILSTDMTSDDETEVVEIMPLPSNPSISKAEVTAFVRVTELVNTYLDIMVNRPVYFYQISLRQSRGGGPEQSVTVNFQQAIGMHFVTVAEAEDAADLMGWLDTFLKNRGYTFTLPSKLKGLLEEYIRDELRFFCVDMIKTNSTVKTVDPLIYEFNTSELYYPLRVSSLFSGETDISLFTLTTSEIKEDTVLETQFIKRAQFQIRRESVANIGANMTNLFSSDPYLSYFSFSGSQDSFTHDILAEAQPNSDTPFIVLAALNVSCGLGLLLLLFPSKTSRFPRIRELSLPKRIQLAFLSTGLIGICLVWVGFTSPWGLAAAGTNRELLLQFEGGRATSQLMDLAGLAYILLLLAVIPNYIFLLLIGGNSKTVGVNFAALGTCTLTLTTVTGISVLSSAGIGMYYTLAGCTLIILSGLLSVHRLKLDPHIADGRTKFKTCITRRFLIAVLTIIGVLVIVFWLASHMPGYRIY